MATAHANPSRDPANDDSLLGMVRQVLDKFLQGVDDMLPARVVSYDRDSNRATVVPMVKVLTTDGRQIGRAQVASVPVMQFGGGGVALSFNLTAGDIGWIKANDRDISLILQAYGDNAPNTLRKHSFQDAVFIPDVMRGMVIAAEDETNAVLQTLDGTARLALWPTFLKVTAPRGLVVSDQAGEGSPNAVLDVQSTIKAAMPWPRMTQGQRDAIPSPQEGMAVWNLTTHGVSTYNGTTWS